MTLEYKKISKHRQDLDLFSDDIQKVWDDRGGGPGIEDLFTKKLEGLDKGESEGLFLYDNGIPQALGWVEKSTPYYGNIFLHSKDEKYSEDLINELIKENFFDNAILELVQIREYSNYMGILNQKNLTINERQRMYLWLQENAYFDVHPGEYHYEYLTEDDIKECARMSVAAHKISKDYEMYPELMEDDKREVLERRVYDGLYGPLIREGSIKAVDKSGKMVGFTTMIEVTCWGHEKVPWIFDMVMDPVYHGQGIGRNLMWQSINILTEMKFPIIGLAVTTSNEHALRLYEKSGFLALDTFYEYMREV